MENECEFWGKFVDLARFLHYIALLELFEAYYVTFHFLDHTSQEIHQTIDVV